MTRFLQGSGVKFNGKFNSTKLSVLATLYYFTVSLGGPGLSLQELVPRTGASYDYLRCRLPVFANVNGKWRHQYVLRKAAIRGNRAVFIYSLSAYGRSWCEDKVPREVFSSFVKQLRPLWKPINEL